MAIILHFWLTIVNFAENQCFALSFIALISIKFQSVHLEKYSSLLSSETDVATPKELAAVWILFVWSWITKANGILPVATATCTWIRCHTPGRREKASYTKDGRDREFCWSLEWPLKLVDNVWASSARLLRELAQNEANGKVWSGRYLQRKAMRAWCRIGKTLAFGDIFR